VRKTLEILQGFFAFRLLEFFVLPAKSLDSSRRINQLLFPSIERMALGADFNPNILLRGTGRDFISASTFDHGLKIVGMDIFFHLKESSFVSLIPELFIIHHWCGFSRTSKKNFSPRKARKTRKKRLGRFNFVVFVFFVVWAFLSDSH
jgi:hypothetical protein